MVPRRWKIHNTENTYNTRNTINTNHIYSIFYTYNTTVHTSRTRFRGQIRKPLDAEKDAAVTAWLDALPEPKRTYMLNAAASLLAESTQKDSLGHVFNYGNRNDIWEVFLTLPGTNMLAGQLKLDPFYHEEDPFVNLLDHVATEKTPQARVRCLLDAIGDSKQNQDILLKGMLLAVTRFYTANGANVINPGYGGFAPPKNAGEMESRLQALLKRNQYLTSGQRSQAKSEYRQTVNCSTGRLNRRCLSDIPVRFGTAVMLPWLRRYLSRDMMPGSRGL